MAVQNGVDDRQPRAVVAVGVSAQLVFDLMRLKIRDLADLQHAVLCHGGLIDIIGEVVFIRLAEVGFHRVAQRVERAGDDLLHGNGQRIGWGLRTRIPPARPKERP